MDRKIERNKIKIGFLFICLMLCTNVEASIAFNKDLKKNTSSEIQYKKFRPTGRHAKGGVPKADSKHTHDKALKADDDAQYQRLSGKLGSNNKKNPKINPICNIVREKVYLKAGLGSMQYATFKETFGGYIKKAPKKSPVYSIGIGYKFSESVRADLNFNYSQTTYKANAKESYFGLTANRNLQQKIKTMTLFVNGYYDINLHKTIIPYLTAGVGISKNTAKDANGKFVINKMEPLLEKHKGKTTTNLAWNVGFGMKFDLNAHSSIDLGYRYVDLGTVQTGQDISAPSAKMGKQKLRGHQGMISLIYNF